MRYQIPILLFVIILSTVLFQASRGENVDTKNVGGTARVFKNIRIDQGSKVKNENDAVIRSVYSTDASIKYAQNTSSTPTLQNATIQETALIAPTQTTHGTIQCSSTAPLYAVYNIGTAQIVLGQDGTHRWPIASITKLMTAIVVNTEMNENTNITITDEDHEKADGFSSLIVGATYTVKDLVKAALLVSSNDATYALARTYGYDAFISKMNEKAQALNMKDTYFYDPSGLSYLNQSTMRDLGKLMSYMYTTHGSLLAITRQPKVSIYDMTNKKTTTLLNINYFAGQSGFIGGKTGYITQSGENLVTLFSNKDTVWMIGVLGSTDRFGDVKRLLQCAKEHE